MLDNIILRGVFNFFPPYLDTVHEEGQTLETSLSIMQCSITPSLFMTSILKYVIKWKLLWPCQQKLNIGMIKVDSIAESCIGLHYFFTRCLFILGVECFSTYLWLYPASISLCICGTPIGTFVPTYGTVNSYQCILSNPLWPTKLLMMHYLNIFSMFAKENDCFNLPQ